MRLALGWEVIVVLRRGRDELELGRRLKSTGADCSQKGEQWMMVDQDRLANSLTIGLVRFKLKKGSHRRYGVRQLPAAVTLRRCVKSFQSHRGVIASRI